MAATVFGLIGVFVVGMVCALSLGFALPEQAQRLRELLFPWTLPEVKSAFSELTTQIRRGEPLQTAVSAFCEEILDGAYDAR